MSILSDNQLRERLNEVFPEQYIHEKQIQPASIDLRLGKELKFLNGEEVSDLKEYTLKPKEFVLGSTYEKVCIPNDLVGIVNGKSSLARIGLMVHVTAGFIDPGFKGNITLELYNVSDCPIILENNCNICQLILEELTSEVSRPYGSEELNSHYQNSEGTIRSWL